MRAELTNASWTAIGELEVNTLVAAEGGDIRLQTGDTTGVAVGNGHLLSRGKSIVVPAGLTLSAVAVSRFALIQTIDFGVAEA